ncbi:hypothetical protein ACWDTT_10505 [Streptosporangium sandarakinum]
MAGFDTALVLGLVVGPFLSLIVGLVTKASWSGAVKGILLAALAAADGFIVSWQQAAEAGAAFDWKTAFLVALGAFIAAHTTHGAIWKTTGATAAVQRTLVKDRLDLAA